MQMSNLFVFRDGSTEIFNFYSLKFKFYKYLIYLQITFHIIYLQILIHIYTSLFLHCSHCIDLQRIQIHCASPYSRDFKTIQFYKVYYINKVYVYKSVFYDFKYFFIQFFIVLWSFDFCNYI